MGDQSVAVLPDHGRKLIAVVYADMVGYSRLIGQDDAGTFERLRDIRRGDSIPYPVKIRRHPLRPGADSTQTAIGLV
jgi:hypothetical protein